MRATHRTSLDTSRSVTMATSGARGLLARLGRKDRDAFERVAMAELPGLEGVLPGLSRAADHGILWLGAAAALGATGRPRLRRAALRGLAGIAVASPVVNLIGKQAFHRRRPVVDLVPPVRIRWRLPTSHAFPSGHSASAAAFATGVAMEAPAAVAVPVAGLAAAVCFSRVYTGAHYPGDVLAGVAVGVLAAVGTRLAAPARPAIAKATHTATEQMVVHGYGRGIVAVVVAGARDADGPPVPDHAESAARILARELPDAEIVRVGPGGDPASALDEAASRAEALAVVGGDGTVNAAARAALAHKVPLLVIPGGALGRFARALGIETVSDAVTAYRDGRLGRVDVARVTPGDGVFLSTAGLGAYADLVARRERLEGRLGRRLALVLAAVRTLRDLEPREMIIDGRPRRVWLGFVGNGVHGSRGPAPTRRTGLTDGTFDVRVIEIGRRAPRVRALASVLGGGLPLAPGFVAWKSGVLDLTDRAGAIKLAFDGEAADLASTVRFAVEPKALEVFVPRRRH